MRPGAFGVGHALHAMHAGFEFELGEGAAAADLGDDFLVAAHAAFARRDHLDLPALLGGVALVHAEQVAGEQRGLVAAGAGADFEDDVALVHRVLGQQREPDLLLQRGSALLRAPASRLAAMRAHLGVGRGIGEQRFEPGDLGGDVAIGLDGLDDGPKLGEFARQLHVGFRRQRAGKLVLHAWRGG